MWLSIFSTLLGDEPEYNIPEDKFTYLKFTYLSGMAVKSMSFCDDSFGISGIL